MRETSSAESPRFLRQLLPGLEPAFPCFSQQEISDDCLNRIIEVACLEPSGWNLQSRRWIVVRGHAAKKHLESAACLKVPLSSAPVVLVCLADTLGWKSAPQFFQNLISERKITDEEAREALRRLREYYTSSPETAKRTALANAFVGVYHVLLSAAESRLAGYWINEFDEPRIMTHFHIPDQFLVAALVPLGYREETPAAPVSKFPSRTIIYNEKFGGVLSPAS